MEHFAEALLQGKADAVLAASLFHYHEVDIGALKTYLPPGESRFVQW